VLLDTAGFSSWRDRVTIGFEFACRMGMFRGKVVVE
jgi:hypothetical protein